MVGLAGTKLPNLISEGRGTLTSIPIFVIYTHTFRSIHDHEKLLPLPIPALGVSSGCPLR